MGTRVAFGVPLKVRVPDAYSPTWELAARVTQRSLDPGDRVEVQVFFTGTGRPASSKLTVFIPPTIFDGKAPSTVTANISRIVVKDPSTGDYLEFPAWQAQSASIEGGVASIGLSPGFSLPTFVQAPPPRTYEVISQVAGESLFENQAPVSLSWALPGDAPPGDHSVQLTLTYLSGKEAKACAYELTLHVRPFWERTAFQILAGASAIVVILVAVTPLIAKLATWLGSLW